MAYVDQQKKNKLAPQIKAVLKKYGVKASIAVRHHLTLVVNIRSGNIDFIGNHNDINYKNMASNGYIDVNVYWYHEHFSGVAKRFLDELVDAARGTDWFDHSDSQTDFFHCSHYIDINIGSWQQPYVFEK